MFKKSMILIGSILVVQAYAAGPPIKLVQNQQLQQAVFQLKDIVAKQTQKLKKTGRPYYEYLRVAAISSGIYVLPKGMKDDQQPHTSDEVYYVISGKAQLKIGHRSYPVTAGSIAYVAKDTPHHFFKVIQKLTVLVVMAPAEKTPIILWLHQKGLSVSQIATVVHVKVAVVRLIVGKVGS